MTSYPIAPDDVTPRWLSELLGTEVSGLRWEAIGTGQVGDSVRFHLEYDGAAGPPTIAAKFPAADDASRGTAAMMGLYAKEVAFYREVAPQIETRTPAIYFAAASEDGANFCLVFEDLGPAKGGDQLSGCSLEEARLAVGQAAALHAPSWHNPAMLGLEWLQPKEAMLAQIRTMYPQAQTVFRERYADTLDPEYMALCEKLAAAGGGIRENAEVVSLVHGDFRLDNLLFDVRGGAEPIAVLDWQTLTIGNGLTDIGYFLGCGIGDELRRAHEGELLDCYCDEMTRRGVPLTRDDIWRDYVIGALHGVGTAIFSAAFVERTERGDANFLSMARGACALALEHGSLEMLEQE